MKGKTYVGLAITVVAMLVLGLGCASAPTPTAATTPGASQPATGAAPTPAQGPIKIGFIGNLSAASSISAKASAQLAVEEMNKAGGILGRQIELIVEDDKGEIPKCVEIYKKLVMVDKVVLVVIGEKVEMGVAGMETGAELFREFPHIFISTIGSGDVIWHHVRDNYEKYKFGFQTYYFTSSGYLTILGNEILPSLYKDTMGIKKVALVYEDMEWTKPLRQGLEGVSPRLADVYKSKGLEVVYETTVSVDQKVFTSVLEEIGRSGAEVIDNVVGYIDEAAFVKQWAQSGARNIPLYFWGGLVGMPAAWSGTEGKVLGVMVGSSQAKVKITDKTIPFMETLQAKYNVGPIFGSHTTYDSLYGFKAAVEAAGSFGKVEDIIHKMETVEATATLGAIGWDPKCHFNLSHPKYVTPIIQWQKDGAMGVIWPAQYANAEYASPASLRGG